MRNTNKTSRIVPAIIAAVTVICAAVFSACPNTPEEIISLVNLEAEIAASETLLDSVKISDNGADLEAGEKYVTQEEYNVLKNAVNEAKAVIVKTDVTQEQIDAARIALLTARETFEKAIETTYPATMVRFKAPNAVYDGTAAVSGFASGEQFLVFPVMVDILNDTISVEAKIKYTSTSGHNGTGFITVSGSARKGYMMLTAQNVKNVGTTNGLSGQGFDESFTWPSAGEYIFKSEISGGKINHYVYNLDRTTIVAQKTGTDVTLGHAETDVVYAAVGGTGVNNMQWSDIIVTRNNIKYTIDKLEDQTYLPQLSVDAATARVKLNEQGTVGYTATVSGGEAAAITAVSDDAAIVRIDSAAGGEIKFTGLKSGNAVITVTNTAIPALKAAITVTVTDFPETDAYGALGSKTYPVAGSTGAYTDGEIMLTFDAAPKLETGGSVSIFNADGTLADVILFADETQSTLNGTLNVGSQLARVGGNSVYITPHNGKLEYSKKYYVAIPRGAITGTINSKTFNGLTDNKDAASWSFTTKAAPTMDPATPVTVDGSQPSKPNFRTVYGALSAIAAAEGNWTVNVAPGVYSELVHYKTNKIQTVTINGTGTEVFGKAVIIQFTNSEKMNGGTHTRPSFYFSGANLVLKNIMLKNTSKREASYDPGQAESIYFANGTGKTFAAFNSSFLSHQDTIQTTGRNWFYKCYIEGDTDYIWGTAETCLLEECELVSVNDPNRSTKTAMLIVARTGSTTANTVPKGYVLFNSKVTTKDGMTAYFGRNAGAGEYYDQLAVINTSFVNDGTGKVSPDIWSGSVYTPLDGKEEHVGLKFYGNTLSGSALDVINAVKGKPIAETVYNLEYNGRRTILNRVYDKQENKYSAITGSNVWDVAALETAFEAVVDASKDNEYEEEPSGPEVGKTYTWNLGDGSVFPQSTISAVVENGFIKIDPTGGTIAFNGAQHGFVLKNSNKISIQVAGNVTISVLSCQYTNDTCMVQLTSSTAGNTISPSEPINNKVPTDGQAVDWTYKGPAGEVTLNFTETGSNYVHGIKVTPLTE